MLKRDLFAIVRIVGTYLAFSALWIVTSDHLVASLAQGRAQLSRYQTAKGLAFVGASALVVLALLWRELRRRRRVEEALAEQESRYRALLEETQRRAKLGGWRFDARTREGSWTAETARIHDLDPAEPTDVAKGLSFYQGEHRQRIEQAMQAAVERGIPYDLELELVSARGVRKWVRTIGRPVRGEDGQVVEVAGYLQDISEQHELERQLSIAQRMESVGRLAGGVAHDFNNLLTVILSHASFIENDLPPGSALREDATSIREAGERATAVTRQLLALSRRETIRPRGLDLNESVRSLEQMLARLLGEDVVLEVRLADQPMPIEADPSQIEQLMLNLAVNARDAMPDGGRLTIETGRTSVDSEVARTFDLAEPGDFVVLTMRDSGVGMDEATQANIFEPFFTTKEAGKGTGLGLSMVYGIAKSAGGFVRIDSAPQKGASFLVHFPQVDRGATARPSGSTPAAARGAGERILLVEDDPVVRRLTRRILERAGYVVLDAGSGVEALQRFDETREPLALLLTDVIMPEMNGHELAKRLHALRPQLKTVFFSGYTDDVIARHGVLHEGVTLVEKPFTARALLTTIRAVLDGEQPGGLG